MVQISSIKLTSRVYIYDKFIVHFMIFTSYILSLVMTTPTTTRLQTSSVDEPLEDTKSPDVGKLLIHKITELIHFIIYILLSFNI